MKKYISTTLIQGEKVILSPHVHSIVYIRPFIGFFIISLLGLVAALTAPWEVVALWEAGGLVICGIWHIYDRLFYNNMELAVTNKRVVAKTGIISVQSEELQWNKIESIEIRQGILGRMLKYGDVYFSGTGTSFVRFGDVRNPWNVKAKAAEILSN